MKYKDMKIKDLKEFVLACHDAIHHAPMSTNQSAQSSMKDLSNLDNSIAELYRRGYRVRTRTTLDIYKKGK